MGAIDGTHVHATVPAEMVAPFYGRKPYPTQNVLAVVDFDLRFTYILAGWEAQRTILPYFVTHCNDPMV